MMVNWFILVNSKIIIFGPPRPKYVVMPQNKGFSVLVKATRINLPLTIKIRVIIKTDFMKIWLKQSSVTKF